ncbi:uncharacterized protein METZ01_LOCUS240610, partial [marine metagenome]
MMTCTIIKQFYNNFSFKFFICYLLFFPWIVAQTHIPADPYYLLITERAQFNGQLPLQPHIFRPLFHKTDLPAFSFTLRNESYYNDNAPNQENMDVRYFSKGLANFTSLQLALNSNYFSFIVEPYITQEKFVPVQSISRPDVFSKLNDRSLNSSEKPRNSGFRNTLAFIHYKGIGFGWHKGNRWWGPGIHSSLQMTNNTQGFPAQIIGTIKEIRLGSFGLYGLYTFTKINERSGIHAKYFTSINGQLSWYGPFVLSLGFSRNYLTGGMKLSGGYQWTEKDAKNIIFEGIFIKNLVDQEYTVGGHDMWDQTLSGYVSLTFPNKGLKLYLEIGQNDNRMHFADFLS